MQRSDSTCPKCGALITPQLPRCRQCGRYLHGSWLEGYVVDTLLPGHLAAAPGTGLVAITLILYYVLMVLLAGPESFAGFRTLAALQLGATVSTEIQDLEVWRFVSSFVAHGSLLHIVFNLFALQSVGPVVEEIHDRKRLVALFVLTGAVSMFGSYAFHVEVLDEPYFPGSVGASGAISGLAGVAWAASRKRTSSFRSLNGPMTRWVGYMLLWSLVPGIDAAAHVAGLLAGAFLGWLVPEGLPRTRSAHRAWTAAALGAVAVVVASLTLTLLHARDLPYRLEDDAQPIRLMGLELAPGTSWEQSGQLAAVKGCMNRAIAAEADDDLRGAIAACELAIRAVPWDPASHHLLGALLERAGQPARAARQKAIATRLSR